MSRENSQGSLPTKDATDTGSMGEQDYLTPMETRNHLRLVWAKESEFLKVVLGALGIKMLDTEHSVDVFFLSVLPVPPLRFRPVSWNLYAPCLSESVFASACPNSS